ncbi:MAG: tetratricopeptide repeat protein [Pseudomonadota bacterium]
MLFNGNKIVRYVLATLAVTFVVGCAHTATHEVVVLQDAVITIGENEPQVIKKGAKVMIPSDSATTISAPGYSSVLIPPAQSGSSSFTVNLKPAEGWGQDLVSKQLDEELNKALISVNEVQRLLQKNKVEGALSMVEMLEKKYPKLLGLRILKARSYTMLNKKNEAKQVLQSIVKDFPESRTTRKFLEVFLKGNELRTPASLCEEIEEVGETK